MTTRVPTAEDWERWFSTNGCVRVEDRIAAEEAVISVRKEQYKGGFLCVVLTAPTDLRQAIVTYALLIQGDTDAAVQTASQTMAGAVVMNAAIRQYAQGLPFRGGIIDGLNSNDVKVSKAAGAVKTWMEENPDRMFSENAPQLSDVIGMDLLSDENREAVNNVNDSVWDYYLAQRNGDANRDMSDMQYTAYKHGICGMSVYNEIILLVSMPRIKRVWIDNRWVFHCEDGPAIEWGPAAVVYIWKGVEVPMELIESPETFDPTLGFTHENMEIRRCIAEKLGMDKVLAAAGAKKFASDSFGDLYRTSAFKDDAGKDAVFARVVCNSTGRVYWLRVPPDTRRPRQGIAWTFEVDEKTYNPWVQT